MLYPDSLTLPPRTGAVGHVVLPGSKSISNRMLLLAALADGATRLHHVLKSDDTAVMMDCLRTLGVVIEEHADNAEQSAIAGTRSVNALELTVHGVSGVFPTIGSVEKPLQLCVGNSGLTIRTLVPALAVAFAKSGGCAEIRGVPRMHERPIGDLVDGLRAIGAQIDYLENDGFPPLRVTGVALRDQSTMTVKGSTSSQFLTGLCRDHRGGT